MIDKTYESVHRANNLLKQQDLVSNTNTVLCSNIIQINCTAYLAYILDLGSHLITAHILTEQYTNSTDIVKLLEKALVGRPQEGKTTIIHSDQGSQYTSREFIEFALAAGLQVSRANRSSHENLAAESFNKTIKRLIRRRLILEHTNKSSNANKASLDRLSRLIHLKDLALKLNLAIEEYNSRPHAVKGELQASPLSKDKDEALYNQPPFSKSHTYNENNEKALAVRAYRAEGINKYAGNWEKFFIDWKQEQALQHEQLYELNQKLHAQNAELQNQVSFLVKEAELLKQQRES